jgi:hypothetical protein
MEAEGRKKRPGMYVPVPLRVLVPPQEAEKGAIGQGVKDLEKQERGSRKKAGSTASRVKFFPRCFKPGKSLHFNVQ